MSAEDKPGFYRCKMWFRNSTDTTGKVELVLFYSIFSYLGFHFY